VLAHAHASGPMGPLLIIGWVLWALLIASFVTIQVLLRSRYVKEQPRILLQLLIASSPGWCAKIVCLPAQEVLAVQALRNVLLVAVFTGTLTFNSGVSALNAITSGDSLSDSDWRLLVLSICFFISFLNWAACVRASVHVGLLLSAAAGRMPRGGDGGGVAAAAPLAPPEGQDGDEEAASRAMAAALVQRSRWHQGGTLREGAPGGPAAPTLGPAVSRIIARRYESLLLTPLEASAVTERSEVRGLEGGRAPLWEESWAPHRRRHWSTFLHTSTSTF